MSTDPHSSLREAIGKALEANNKTTSAATKTGAASLSDAIATHYTPTKKEDHHDD
ncbi:hypothetical protein [Gordonia rubripertincta]|uniref:hypothetical protein n=1 Tax=Gordonia rubripertincta TaxID=36822 RepID=UPI0015F85AF2|nr:hypothetical protein [Gordonia rubripertincta]QMU22888.1 hypothetical protein H3V45_10660 [Gordonia rubripertincta]